VAHAGPRERKTKSAGSGTSYHRIGVLAGETARRPRARLRRLVARQKKAGALMAEYSFWNPVLNRPSSFPPWHPREPAVLKSS